MNGYARSCLMRNLLALELVQLELVQLLWGRTSAFRV